jgi:aldose 1-epimerase
MIPNGEFLPYNKFIKMNNISDRFLDNCFSVKSANVLFRTSLFDPIKNVMIKVWNETGYRKYNYIHLYTPPHRKSIAIEPTSSPPNSFNSEIDLIVLRPKEKISLSWGIEIEKDKYIMGIN